MFSHRYTPIGALGVTAALFLASCGSTEADTAQAGTPAETPAQSADTGGSDTAGSASSDNTAGSAASAGTDNDSSTANDASTARVPSDFPDVDVLDVRTGGIVNLQSLAPRDKPALLWFFAPH